MEGKKCSRSRMFFRELLHDWDELNIAFQSLLVVGLILFIVVILIAIFSNGGKGIQNSLEVVFRSTLASVFGFLLSSNIKSRNKRRKDEIEKMKLELSKSQDGLDLLDANYEELDGTCKTNIYEDNDINMVQIFTALFICITSIFVIGILLITNNLENVPAVSQIRDLMCSSIGFLIGESSMK